MATPAAAATMPDATALASPSTPPIAAAATTPPPPLAHTAKALIDEVVPPSDVSASPPSSPPHSQVHTPLSSPPPTHARTEASPRVTRPQTPALASAATALQPKHKPAAVGSDRPRLKVVIPPVPPFLHEVDKRDERARLMQLSATRDSAAGQQQQQPELAAVDDDAAFRTPEKQAPPKRKTRASDAADNSEQLLTFYESEYRRSQITPPPSERMLDYKNPPLPPRKVKKRRRLDRPVNPVTGRMSFSALPRLSLSSETSSTTDFSQSSPPRLDTPPGSPVRMASVFRSLADEFAAVQDTPPLRTLRAPPRITRAARHCTPPISSRTRSAIQTPTTTMVLRSRQLNPSKTA